MVRERTEVLPPHDIEAEEAVVAAALTSEQALARTASLLRPADFFSDRTRLIFEAALALWQRNEVVDQVTVAHELARNGAIDDAGGLSYIGRLAAQLPSSSSAEFYAAIVARDATYRRLIRAADQMTRLAYEGGPELDDVMRRCEALLLQVRGGESARTFQHIRDLLDRYLASVLPGEGHAENAPHLYPNAVRTGFADLDELLGGMKRSDLIVVAARPAIGKTTLALNLARNAAVGQRAHVAIFSLEMSAEQLAQRLLAAESSVDATRLRKGEHTEAEERRLMHATGVLAGTEVYVDDTPAISVAELRSKARLLRQEKGLDLVLVDYLQLMQAGTRAENRVQEISLISRSLKQLARELELPVVAVSQLSRAVEQRPNHRPILSDLRESGSIEQDADVVCFIHREAAYMDREQWQQQHPDRPAAAFPENLAELIVAKHRNGPVGAVTLRFRDTFSRFEDLLVREEDL